MIIIIIMIIFHIKLNINILIKKPKKWKFKIVFIITKTMMKEIGNKNIYQFFGDAIYRCFPPSFSSYRLYEISGFNMVIKRTRILSYIFIYNETQKKLIFYFQI